MNNPAQTNAASNLSRTELISALDYEIQTREKSLPVGGWTKLTFSGGFAAAIWKGCEEIAKASFSLHNIILFFLLCSVVLDALSMAAVHFQPKLEKQRTPNKIRTPSHHYPWVRVSLLTDLVRFSSMIAAYFYLTSIPQYFWPSWWVCLFFVSYGVVFFVVLGGFVAHFINRPIRPPEEQPEVKTIYKIIAPLIYFSILAAIVGLLAIHFWSSRGVFSVSDYRLASCWLFSCFYYLFGFG